MRREIDIARHELIGLLVSSGEHQGRVVDETKNTFLVEREDGTEIRVPKRGHRFVFRIGNETFVVNGEDIEFRPEDRTKKVRM